MKRSTKTKMHLEHKYQKTKLWFATGLLTLVGSTIYSQIPEDTLTYYSWDRVVQADPDTVYAIDFTRDKMGSIPESITKFSQLQGLKLTKNKLTGLPEFFSELKSIRFLYLDKNDFTYFPVPIFHLDELVYLDISRNKIGAIPRGISNLKKLKYLDVWDNRFTNIDPAFAKLQQLEFIDLRGTTFAPSFVEKWTNAFPNANVEFDKPCNCLE